MFSSYLGLKVVFGLHLIRGTHQLLHGTEPTGFRRFAIPMVVLWSAASLLIYDIGLLLMTQAPILIGCSWIARGYFQDSHLPSSGRRLVRAAFAMLSATWVYHCATVLLGRHNDLEFVLSLNSFVDLGVQICLGIGLVVCLLDDAHHRLLEAKQEREQLRPEIERDEKLRALGTVVSGVAHERNNPLTVILGYAETLRTTSPHAEELQVIVE
ncbi:MAG: signal transduction histidine kinase [Planctomycetota bacterium]|jgi:signal transduction histidine kinase